MRIDMRGPDGTIYPSIGAFCEIVPPGKIVFTSSALDEHDAPLFELLDTVTFADRGGKTKLTVHVQVLTAGQRAAQYLPSMAEGWNQMLDRLGAFVSKQ